MDIVGLGIDAVKLSVATLTRRMASISKAHSAKGIPSPTHLRPGQGDPARHQAQPGRGSGRGETATAEDLLQVLAAMGDDLKAVRDRALIS
jgi:hypothetical protein